MLPGSLPPSVLTMLSEADSDVSSRAHALPVLDAYMKEVIAAWIV